MFDESEWRKIDRQMRSVARRRAALDAEEAELLVAAKRAEVFVHLGYGSMIEYLQRACGYAPSTAWERMRVAEALEELPVMRGALAAGDLSFSAVRELTRVATTDNEGDWLTAIAGCTAREIEDAVRGHAPGDAPDDPPDRALETRTVKLDLTPEAYALFREARCALARETSDDMTDSDFVAMVCRRALASIGAQVHHDAAVHHAPATTAEAATDATAPGSASSRGHNQPPFQIALTQCRDCKRAWHETGRDSIEVPPAALERALCHAIELGAVDGPAPAPTTRTIPAPVRRAVLARDHHRCRIPGCRSSDHVDVHHIVPRSHGGPPTLANLITLCDRHHTAIHDGRIVLAGGPNDLLVTHADGRPYGAAHSPRGESRPPPLRTSARPHRRPSCHPSALLRQRATFVGQPTAAHVGPPALSTPPNLSFRKPKLSSRRSGSRPHAAHAQRP